MTTKYVIRKTRYYFGPRVTRGLVLDTSGQSARRFASIPEAKAYIAGLDADTYHKGDAETGRPEYDVLREDKVPAYLQSDL